MAKRTPKGTKSRTDNPLTAPAVLALFKEAKRPLSRAEIIRRMKLKKKDKQPLKALLRDMVGSGKIIRIRRAYGLAEAMRCVTGKLQVQRGGFGFVIPEDSRRKDVFVNQRDLGGAWNGDKVVVSIFREGSGGRNHEGRIVRILERGRKQLPARVVKISTGGDWLCRPSDPQLRFGMICSVAKGLDPEPGDMVLVTPGEQLDSTLWEGEIAEVLGPEDDLSVQEALVKSNHGLRTRFPSGSLGQAENLPQEPDEREFAGRKDLRGLDLVTIDGATAKDFDDAIFVERRDKGYRLWVAIADVSHYVPQGSPLDREALERGNSYYFPLSVEPMFPEKLSNGLCSLKPGVDRLAMTVRLDLDEAGRPKGTRVYRSVIRSKARLTYSQVGRAILDRDPDELKKLGPLADMLDLSLDLAKRINRIRVQRGSLDFDLPESEIIFDGSGGIADIRPKPRHWAHRIVEEFMIAANEAVARYLGEQGLPCVYRIHPQADQEKLMNLFKLLARTDLKIKVPKEPTPDKLQQLVAAVRGTGQEYLTSRLLLRSMKQATYSPDNEGHYGLASTDYCHFTSPIRRYADLVVHRLVKIGLGADDGPPQGVPGRKKLKDVCEHISGRERVAMEAEREIRKRMTILFMRDKVGETFQAVISHITDYGFWVELTSVMAEGMVRLSSLDDDYYTYWPRREILVGERTGRAFKLGQTVEVVLEGAYLDRLELDFTLRSVVAAAMDYKDLV